MTRFPRRSLRIGKLSGKGPRGSGEPLAGGRCCFSLGAGRGCEASYEGGGSNGVFESDMIARLQKSTKKLPVQRLKPASTRGSYAESRSCSMTMPSKTPIG